MPAATPIHLLRARQAEAAAVARTAKQALAVAETRVAASAAAPTEPSLTRLKELQSGLAALIQKQAREEAAADAARQQMDAYDEQQAQTAEFRRELDPHPRLAV